MNNFPRRKGEDLTRGQKSVCMAEGQKQKNIAFLINSFYALALNKESDMSGILPISEI